jgi:hypothetical protein
MRAAILSHEGIVMEGSRFLLPSIPKALNENQRSGSRKDDEPARLFLVFLQRSVGKDLYSQAALAIRYTSVKAT